MAGPLGRLQRRAEFLRIAAAQKKWAAPGLILQTAPRPTGEQPEGAVPSAFPRVGFTCSKKVGNSVARNRAKRRLREAARQILSQEANDTNDYVVIGRQETLRRPFDLLLQDLRTALKRVGALRDGGAASQADRRPSGGDAS